MCKLKQPVKFATYHTFAVIQILYLYLFDYVIKCGETSANGLLLLLLQADLDVSHHGKQGHNLLVML